MQILAKSQVSGENFYNFLYIQIREIELENCQFYW